MSEAQTKNISPTGKILLLLLVIGLGTFTAWGIWRAAFPPKPPLQGQMEARTLSVASKSPGRIGRLLVQEGDMVSKGQTLVAMRLPEIEARLNAAEAAEHAAQARQSLVDAGPRPQAIAQARAQWQSAQAQADLAFKTYQREAALYKDGLISAQRHDEIKSRWLAASQEALAAREAYTMAELGARKEEKAAAADLSAEAAAGVEALASLAGDEQLKAPAAGQVDKLLLFEGELAQAGFPILTIVELDEQWVTFNILEEEMPGIQIGGILRGTVPALGNTQINYKIYYISPRANYATWRSSRQDSGYDMKTFEVRARPDKAVAGLRPGMSVLVAR